MYKNQLLLVYQARNLAKSKKKKNKKKTKEKAAEYYSENKEAIKEKSECFKNLSQEEKDKIKEYQRKRYQQLIQYKEEALQNK